MLKCNWLGVMFVSEDFPNAREIEEAIDAKTEELREQAQTEFDEFLDENGLEQIMGVVVKKGSI